MVPRSRFIHDFSRQDIQQEVFILLICLFNYLHLFLNQFDVALENDLLLFYWWYQSTR